MTGSENSSLRVGTYNIHGWRGADGVRDPDRIMEVVESLDADILALQEVVSSREECARCDLVRLAGTLGYHVTFGQTMLRSDTRYGNALLSRDIPVRVRRHDISFPGREPRGALESYFRYGQRTVKIVSTHLGLHGTERRRQVDALLPIITRGNADCTLVFGDFNDWFGWSGLGRRLRRILGGRPTPRTFPSRFPLFRLDRIHAVPWERLGDLHAIDGPGPRLASDHLPLLATVDISAKDH